MMRLDADRNLFVGGVITADGRGMVSSPNSNQWQVREITQGNINFSGFAPGGVLYVDIDISGLGFVANPFFNSPSNGVKFRQLEKQHIFNRCSFNERNTKGWYTQCWYIHIYSI